MRSTSSDSITPLSPDHPLTHTTPALVPSLCKTARMVMRVLPAMSPNLSASIAEVAARSDSAFLEDDEKEEDDEEEDDDSSDSDSKNEDTEDEGPTTEDEDPAVRDEGLDAVDEGLGLGYGALRCQEIALGEGQMPGVFEIGQGSGSDGRTYINIPTYPPPAPLVQTPPSPEWSSGLLPISLAPSIVPSPVSSPIISLTVPSLVASPTMAEGFLTKAALWHVISDTHMENRELRLQIIEERRARLDLAEIVDSISRRQEPKEDV
ncbi:hypothetical protein Tco_0784756 [Tanacetum coccineum]